MKKATAKQIEMANDESKPWWYLSTDGYLCRETPYRALLVESGYISDERTWANFDREFLFYCLSESMRACGEVIEATKEPTPSGESWYMIGKIPVGNSALRVAFSFDPDLLAQLSDKELSEKIREFTLNAIMEIAHARDIRFGLRPDALPGEFSGEKTA